MTDLPRLIVGCGMVLHNNLRCGDGDRLRGSRKFCYVCQHNLDAVKAHAAAHHKYLNGLPKAEVRERDYITGARDAVLGLLPKELKEKASKETEGKR